MERSLRIKRIYALGNYQNIEVEDSITDIPEPIALDVEMMKLLSNLLLSRVESIYQTYVKMRQVNSEKTPDEINALLEDAQLNTYGEIDKYLTTKKGE